MKKYCALLQLIAGMLAGVAIGHWFYHLFLKAVPQAALSQLTTSNARYFHWLYGAGVGVVLFLWTLLGMTVSKMQQAMKPKTGA